jgi:MFS family permease
MFIVAFFFYTGFQVACALAPSGATLLVFRFLGGCFAACPLTNSGAILADIWDNETRGTAMAIFIISPFAGPALGPIVGGYIEVAGVSWRWVFWVLTILAGVCLLLAVFVIPETYAPILLVKKARTIREETGDMRFTAALERQNTRWRARLQTVLGRPFKVLFLEPLIIVLTLYQSYVYGILYLLFTAYPVIFIQGHGLNQGENGLAFLPVFIGGVCGVILNVVWFAPQYKKEAKKYAPFPPPPEARLGMSLYGGPLFIAGIFWLGWTSYPSISLWAPLMAGFPIGISLIFLFLSLSNYMIDAYLVVAASVLASTTVVRSMFGAGFPLFGDQMYTALNPRIASTVLGAAALVVVPVPFLLIKWGPALRKKSRYAMDQPRPMQGTHIHLPVADDQAPNDVKQGADLSETKKGETGNKGTYTIRLGDTMVSR